MNAEIKKNEREFRYLYKLQASGRTNMFGAGPYVQQKFGCDRAEACKIVVYWMNNYEKIAQELGIEI